MGWREWVGTGLQVLAAVLVVSGLWSTKRQLFKDAPPLGASIYLPVWYRFRRLIGRPKVFGGSAHVSHDSAHAEISFTVERTKGPGLPVKEQLAILHQWLQDVDRAQQETANRLERSERDVRREIAQMGDRLEAEARRLERHVAEAVGGRRGRGLDLAALGVVIGVIGTLLTLGS